MLIAETNECTWKMTTTRARFCLRVCVYYSDFNDNDARYCLPQAVRDFPSQQQKKKVSGTKKFLTRNETFIKQSSPFSIARSFLLLSCFASIKGKPEATSSDYGCSRGIHL